MLWDPAAIMVKILLIPYTDCGDLLWDRWHTFEVSENDSQSSQHFTSHATHLGLMGSVRPRLLPCYWHLLLDVVFSTSLPVAYMISIQFICHALYLWFFIPCVLFPLFLSPCLIMSFLLSPIFLFFTIVIDQTGFPPLYWVEPLILLTSVRKANVT